ncbi:5'-nucleotidase C-terminal domain-containing protein [Geofilum rubicundum]|uniref:5'-nucleotidase n=1 Tax=Geofilum rubicundum JCM 15548 TaxID=1236989 RepID=A0A0E9M2G4_9BACT|nr:5'-nucleotidase C-terminal domain-containing protein [Geofilum rubicundum]GAO31709.1 5'-nucleotidase [Geofilum rubicundum JCM 15548]
MRQTFFFFILISLITGGCVNQPLSHKLTHHEFIQVDQPAAIDSTIDAVIKPFRDSLNLSMNTVIGTSSASMRSFKPESPLSSFVADLVYDAGYQYLETQGYTRPKLVALVNVRGLRAPMPEGPVLLRNAYEMMPFENLMTAVLLSGEQMQQFFQLMAHENGDGLSGATFTLTDEGATSIRIDGRPIDESEDYWVVTSDYLAEGGDGYTIFGKSDRHLISNYTIRDLIIERIKSMSEQNQIISPEMGVRITDVR